MSRYRTLVGLNNELIREKRKLFRRFLFFGAYRWSFNRSEESRLNRLKNQLHVAQDDVKTLKRRIPREEKALTKRKDAMILNGNVPLLYREGWSYTRDRVQDNELKPEKTVKKHVKKPTPIATLVTHTKT